MISVTKHFEFLIKEYSFEYSLIRFENFPFGNWYVDMYSYYNKNGCFSIYNIPQRGEWDYFFAKKFSTDITELMEQRIDIAAVEKEIWHKLRRKFLFRLRHNLFHKTLAEVIKKQISEQGEFYGIKVTKCR
jgi:hypothetical protein